MKSRPSLSLDFDNRIRIVKYLSGPFTESLILITNSAVCLNFTMHWVKLGELSKFLPSSAHHIKSANYNWGGASYAPLLQNLN